jgi:predicted amidophosphoribosyltransferase
MLALLFRCIGCEEGLRLASDKPSFPLCRLCYESLTPCPPICYHCGSVRCSNQKTAEGPRCLSPWAHRPLIQSYSARYLLISRTYRILKAWKGRRGLLFDRRILIPDPRLVELWKATEADAVIPVPQNFNRAWKMRGSRALFLANWVSSQTGIPVVQALLPAPRNLAGKRQAELSSHERVCNELSFPLRPYMPAGIRRVILVDDFMTTGHTLNSAAKSLHSAGVTNIHTFCLGMRPSFDFGQAKRCRLTTL